MWDGLFFGASKKIQPCQDLDFRLLAYVIEQIFIVLSGHLCGNLLWQPSEADTTLMVLKDILNIF